MMAYEKVSLYFMGVGMGIVLGATFTTIITSVFNFTNGTFAMIMGILFIIMAVVILYVLEDDPSEEVVTVVSGAYFAMRGLSMFFGGYPSEGRVYSAMVNPYAEPIEVGVMFYVYLGIFVGLNFMFMFLQKNCKFAKRVHIHDKTDDEFKKEGDEEAEGAETAEKQTEAQKEKEKANIETTAQQSELNARVKEAVPAAK